MIQENALIQSVQEIASNIFQLSFVSPAISSTAIPGQFVNVRTEDSNVPLFRRPFSIFNVERNVVSIIFNTVGIGTSLLSRKRPGNLIDVLGPLGHGTFPLRNEPDSTLLIVAGGLGIAAFPFFTSRVIGNPNIVTFAGARTSAQVVRAGLKNVHVATDDGSEGFRGTVVDLLKEYLAKHPPERAHMFSCGPSAMMRAVSAIAREKEIPCHLALECEMACGVGLCQGCPVETLNGEKKYRLVCKEGPVFDARDVNF